MELIDLADSTDLRSVVATIAAADQKVALRFDPERRTPPKLDNQSKPGRRGEGSLVVEALLRALDPAAARSFDALPAEAQEKFRKAFTEFLAAYPSSSDDRRVAFIQRSLVQATGAGEGAGGADAVQPAKAATPAGTPAVAPPTDQPKVAPAAEPAPK